MASITTGNGMSGALKRQDHSVRVAVEQRVRRVPGQDSLDREHWLIPVYATVADAQTGERRAAIVGYEIPRIDGRERHAMANGLALARRSGPSRAGEARARKAA